MKTQGVFPFEKEDLLRNTSVLRCFKHRINQLFREPLNRLLNLIFGMKVKLIL